MYSGFLLKIGDEKFNMKYIKEKTYTAYASVQDLDSYRDADGELRRFPLPHVPIKVEFETIPLTGAQYAEIMAMMRRNYTNTLERKLPITAFLPEYNDYISQDAYLVEPQPKVNIIRNNTDVQYDSLRIAFVGY